MRQLGPRWRIGLAWAVIVACAEPAASPTRSPAPADDAVEEIEGPVAPPGPRVVDATGELRFDADPHEMRAAGDYYYRSGDLTRAHWCYTACSARADGLLEAACQWAVGATLVTRARQLADEHVEHEQALGLQPRRPAAPECTPGYYEFGRALGLLRMAYRSQATARRARIIAAVYEEIGLDGAALNFYEQALALDPNDSNIARAIAELHSRGPHPACPKCFATPRTECRPRDCPTLPFGWHRREGELEVLGSGLEGSSRARVFDCFGEPASFSSDTWNYWQGQCRPSVVTTVRLHFDDDIVDRVTHERTVDARDRDCGLVTY
jgi:tetratricopeptide (TPR) repeat protein